MRGDDRISERDPDRTETDRRTEAIRRDIERTREDMSETVEALQEKLKPANVVSSATDRVRTATTERVRQMTHSARETAGGVMDEARDRADGLAETARDNAIPLTLIGVGAAWWLVNRWRDSDGYDDYDGARYRSRAWRGPANRGSLRGGTYSGSEASWTAEPHDDDEEAGGTVSRAASGAADSARGAWSSAEDYTSSASRKAGRAGRRATTKLERMTRENPLAVGAGALLLGAVTGLLVPETERENEWMGETRDSMVEGAGQMVRDAASRAEDAARDLAGEAASRIVTGKHE